MRNLLPFAEKHQYRRERHLVEIADCGIRACKRATGSLQLLAAKLNQLFKDHAQILRFHSARRKSKIPIRFHAEP
jgi:hypothetical protein